jgi:hypothetical protein
MADKDALASFQRKRKFDTAIKKRSRRSDIAKRAVADVEARRKDKDRAQLETIEFSDTAKRAIAAVEARRKEIEFFPSRYDVEAKPPPSGGGLFLLWAWSWLRWLLFTAVKVVGWVLFWPHILLFQKLFGKNVGATAPPPPPPPVRVPRGAATRYWGDTGDSEEDDEDPCEEICY